MSELMTYISYHNFLIRSFFTVHVTVGPYWKQQMYQVILCSHLLVIEQ